MIKVSLSYLIIIILLIACYKHTDARNRLATVSKPQVSPSGKYVLKTLVKKEVRCEQFEIKEKDNKKNVFRLNDCLFRLRDVNYFLWDDYEDIVWTYSGDLGLFYWKMDSNGKWIKYVYVYGKDKGAPKLLKELLKNLFPDLQ